MTTMSFHRKPKPEDLEARRHGDRLRVSLKRMPSPRVSNVSGAEQAAAMSEQALNDAAMAHQRNLARLARARVQIGVASTGDTAVPTVDEMVMPHRTLPDLLIGWVTSRDRLTDDSKTAGTLRLECGETLKWTASSAYVDALDVLFDGAPISVRGPLMGDGWISIQEVQPAAREYWRDTEDYAAASVLGPMTVMVTSVMKRDLMAAHGSSCQSCGKAIGKPKKASIAELEDGTRLVCRPCKQAWVDAGRPNGLVPSVAGPAVLVTPPVSLPKQKKRLMYEVGNRCQACLKGFPSHRSACLAVTDDNGHLLLCKACFSEGALGAVRTVA